MEERSARRSLLHFFRSRFPSSRHRRQPSLLVVPRKLLSAEPAQASCTPSRASAWAPMSSPRRPGRRVKGPVGANPAPRRPPRRCAARASVSTASCERRPRSGETPMPLGRAPLWRSACTRSPSRIAPRCSGTRKLYVDQRPEPRQRPHQNLPRDGRPAGRAHGGSEFWRICAKLLELPTIPNSFRGVCQFTAPSCAD